ncbi:ankyrin repeat containing protein [Colletotrichum incanum]|uniref:Ankyrin repeat containing protein n=1 Tax=Colletotrichum incanum TaxID=1573173 RepID=A0A162NSN2_COLIC|nr:ankyrin repeat containing protein [Colletotrichum incanum]
MENAETSLAEAYCSACQGTDDTAGGQPQFLAVLEDCLIYPKRDKLPDCVTNAIKSRFLPCSASSKDPEAWVLHQRSGKAADDTATYLYDELNALCTSIDPSDMTRFDFAKRNVWLVAFARIRRLYGSNNDGRSLLLDHLTMEQEDKVRQNCNNFAVAGERLEFILSKAGGSGALICGLQLSLNKLARKGRFDNVNIETICKSLSWENIRRCNQIVDALLELYESRVRSKIDLQEAANSEQYHEESCKSRKRKREPSDEIPRPPPDSPLAIADDELHIPNNAAHCHYDAEPRGPVASHAGPSHSLAPQLTDASYSPSTATTRPITPPARGTYGESVADNDDQKPPLGRASTVASSMGGHSRYTDVLGNVQQQLTAPLNALFRNTFGAHQQFPHGKKRPRPNIYYPRPQRQLTMQRKVPDTAFSIRYAMDGNIDGLKDLFAHGLASPWDISDSRGYSLIRWALYGGMHQYRTVQYLMREGAPVDQESYDHVWDFGFRRKCTDEELEALGCIRNALDRDWIDEQKFPLIHKIVFGLDLKPLVDELEENPNAVHLKDAQGRTALDWATARAQLHDMRLLIEHGSDVNTIDASGRTTVLHAVDSHSDAALQIVLEAKADPNPAIPNGLRRSSPLISACFGGLKEMIRLLLKSSARVDACKPEGRTALRTVASSQNVECAVILLEHGARVDEGSLAMSIIHNNHKMLELFVRGCDHLRRSPLLPIISKHANEQTMSILASSHPFLKILDLSCDDSVREILGKRVDYCERLGSAFNGLLAAAASSQRLTFVPDEQAIEKARTAQANHYSP